MFGSQTKLAPDERKGTMLGCNAERSSVHL